jgi:hypothetical protein
VQLINALIIAALLFTACGRGQMAENDLTESFNYGTTGESRQVLDLYRAASATVENPGPVYLWAHPNGSTYRSNLPSAELRRQLAERGVSVISWESHATLTPANEADVTTDAALMLDWVRTNAARLGWTQTASCWVARLAAPSRAGRSATTRRTRRSSSACS